MWRQELYLSSDQNSWQDQILGNDFQIMTRAQNSNSETKHLDDCCSTMFELCCICPVQDDPFEGQGRGSWTGCSGLQQWVQHRQTGGQGALPYLLPARSVDQSSKRNTAKWITLLPLWNKTIQCRNKDSKSQSTDLLKQLFSPEIGCHKLYLLYI